MNVLKICFATCGTFLLSATSAYAVAISGGFKYDETTLSTPSFPETTATLSAGSVTFNFNTATNTGTVSSLGGLSGTIITGSGGSTFSPTLFVDFVARYDFGGGILIDFKTNFLGQSNNLGDTTTAFSITTVGPSFEFVSGTGNIREFAQAVPYEFESAIGISLYGGFFVTRKLLKARNNKNLRN